MKRSLLILIGSLVMLLGNVAAQKMVYLEHCEKLSFDQKRVNAQLLTGNVRFRHEGTLMYCDTAYFYEHSNSLDAFGHVRLVQGDTIDCTGRLLHYDGNAQLARITHDVVLTHLSTVLYTDILFYDKRNNRAYYTTGGTIHDGDDVLTSVWGVYDMAHQSAEFRDEVHLNNEEFDMHTDSLVYHMEQHVATLVRPSTIVYKDETTILSHDGWYNTTTQMGMLMSSSRILHIDGKQLTGDTIIYDRNQGIGQVFGHMELRDTVQKASLFGNYGIMYEENKSGFATDSAYILDWSDDNLTYVHADTIFAEPIDSSYHRVRAFHNVRAYSNDFQFVCDSVVYDGRDSLVIMYTEPVLWSQSNQVSADTVFVYLNDSSISHICGTGSAFGVKQEGAEEFDQLCGKEMKAIVNDGHITEIQVSGNAETVFYPRNEDSTYVGVNKSQSSYVTIYLEINKIHHVLFTTSTTGTLYPLNMINVEDTRLLGFFWATQERPTSHQSIFDRPARTPRPTQKAISAADDKEEEPTTTTTKTKRNRKEK